MPELNALQKVTTGFYPTPLEEMKNLSAKLGKARLLIKRDDLTGLGFGGNKARKLDYLVQDALAKGCTTLLTYGGPQTNHGRMTAAAAARFGLKAILICYGRAPQRATGNLLLDRILGVDVYFLDTSTIDLGADTGKELGCAQSRRSLAIQDFRDKATKQVIETYEARGEKVYVVPIGGHAPDATAGYMHAVAETMQQLKATEQTAHYMVTGFGSTGTFAGLWLGAKYYNAPFEVVGIAVSHITCDAITETARFINLVSKRLRLGIVCKEEELWVERDYAAQGYNVPDPYTRQAIYLMAQTEGIFLDPCYTGKSFRGFVDLVTSEKIASDKTAIYLHTGGTPALFSEEHLAKMQDEIWGEDHYTVFDYSNLK